MTGESIPWRSFRTLKHAHIQGSRARTGVLRLSPAVEPICTPSFLCPTSRGTVQHLTPDLVEASKTNIPGVVVGAEDFMEKSPKDIALVSEGCPGRDVFCLPSRIPLVISPRRSAPVPSPQTNSDDNISVMTSEGFRYMPLAMYHTFITRLNPDLVFSVPDIPNLSPGGVPGTNRKRKMLLRTERWLKELMALRDSTESQFDIVAAILPGLSASAQAEYLDTIKSNPGISGITVWKSGGRLSEKQAQLLDRQQSSKNTHDASSHTVASYVDALGDSVPRLMLCFGSPVETPHQILELVSEGMDMFMATGISGCTDSGLALDFTFPATAEHPSTGFNLWDSAYTTDTASFGVATTGKVPCGNYNRAYVHHLLLAHEMTAWVLLQQHNLAVYSAFFDGVRACIEDGTFETECARFTEVYGSADSFLALRDQFKAKDSVPKVRGYTVDYAQGVARRSEGSSKRLNDPTFRKL